MSSHILHEIESMTSNILLINQGRILAEGNVHQIRDLIDEHPHTVYVKADEPRALARAFLAEDDVLSLQVRGRGGRRADRASRCVLRAADRHRRVRRARRHPRGHVARRQPAGGLQVPGEVMTPPRASRPTLLASASASSTCRSARCSGRAVGLSGAARRRSGRAGARRSGSLVGCRACRAAPDQRRAPRRAGDVRHDDLAALHPLHRAGARRLLRHVADRRRSRRQDDHLSVHRPIPRARCCSASTSPTWSARCCSSCRRSCSCTSWSCRSAAAASAPRFPSLVDRPRACSALGLAAYGAVFALVGARLKRRWWSAWSSRSAGSRASCCFRAT